MSYPLCDSLQIVNESTGTVTMEAYPHFIRIVIRSSDGPDAPAWGDCSGGLCPW